MTRIHSVSPGPDAASDQEQARALFREYGLFLQATQSCGFFSLAKFGEEIRTLPAFYTDSGGELLLARTNTLDSAGAGCIAYRANPNNDSSCEIKRLFVLPGFRGQGLARQLIAAAMDRAIQRGYTHAILDTDVAHMPGAFALYTDFGFREYAPRKGSIAFLDCSLRGTHAPAAASSTQQ